MAAASSLLSIEGTLERETGANGVTKTLDLHSLSCPGCKRFEPALLPVHVHTLVFTASTTVKERQHFPPNHVHTCDCAHTEQDYLCSPIFQPPFIPLQLPAPSDFLTVAHSSVSDKDPSSSSDRSGTQQVSKMAGILTFIALAIFGLISQLALPVSAMAEFSICAWKDTMPLLYHEYDTNACVSKSCPPSGLRSAASIFRSLSYHLVEANKA